MSTPPYHRLPLKARPGSGWLVNIAQQTAGSVGLAILTMVLGAVAGKGTIQVAGFSAVLNAATLFYGRALVPALFMAAASRRADSVAAPAW